MTNKRLAHVLVGVASLVTALVLLVGVPLLLVSSVGWPLPTSIPSLGTLEQAARSGIGDQVVVNALAVIAWLAWATCTLAFAVETATIARGHHATSLPVLPASGSPWRVCHRNPHARLDRRARGCPRRTDDRPGCAIHGGDRPAGTYPGPRSSTRPVGRRWERTQSRGRPPLVLGSRPSPSRGTTASGPSWNNSWRRTPLEGDPRPECRARDPRRLHHHCERRHPAGAVLLPLPPPLERSTPNAATPPQTQPFDALSEPSTVTVEPGDNLWTISDTDSASTSAASPTTPKSPRTGVMSSTRSRTASSSPATPTSSTRARPSPSRPPVTLRPHRRPAKLLHRPRRRNRPP